MAESDAENRITKTGKAFNNRYCHVYLICIGLIEHVTEYADTARYLYNELSKRKISDLAQIDSARNFDRVDIIERFSPYYNGQTSNTLKERGKKEINI